MTIDQFVAVLASLGACASAIATYMTVRQMDLQRRAAYRPDLVLSRIFFHGSPPEEKEGGAPTCWSEGELDKENSEEIQAFIPIQNVGLGAAKSLQISWDFSIGEVAALINETAQRSLTALYVLVENGLVNVKSDAEGSNCLIVWRNESLQSLDYVLPSSVDKIPIQLPLPRTYTYLASLLLHVALRESDSASKNGSFSLPDVPTLVLNVSYLDIGGDRHVTRFRIDFNLLSIHRVSRKMQLFLQPCRVC